MAQIRQRTPKNYDGTQVTTHRVGDLLPKVLEKIGEVYQDRPDLILAAWPDIIGPQLSTKTKAVSFINGNLLVKVTNSTTHSVLHQYDKQKILEKLRQKFPKIKINNVFFRIG